MKKRELKLRIKRLERDKLHLEIQLLKIKNKNDEALKKRWEPAP